MAITFVATLFIPLQYAVLLGVAVSVLLFVIEKSNEVTVKEWVYRPGERVIERDAPATLPPNQVSILVPYGSLFFAAVSLFEEQLPDITPETRHAVVILNLRGKQDLGSTFLNVLERYAEDMSEHSSKLMLAEVNQHVIDQLQQTGLVQAIQHEDVFRQTEFLWESAVDAYDQAVKWIEDSRQQPN